jgi:hypothetical protein
MGQTVPIMSAVPSVGVRRSRYMPVPPLIGRVSEHQDELKGELDDSLADLPRTALRRRIVVLTSTGGGIGIVVTSPFC